MEIANPNNADSMEILADPIKYVTLPIQFEKLWRKYQTSLDWFWTVYEVNIEKDRPSMLETFNEEQRSYILKVLAFMLITHNTIVKKELFLDLINQVEIKEASYYFGSQADSKKTHSMMYSMLLDELIGDADKKAQIMSEVARIPEVRDTLKWYVENIVMEDQSFAKRMLTFATIQGILFTVPFILFSWIEKQHPSAMSGLMKSNNLIWRDERLNLSLSTMLFDYIEDAVDESEAMEIVKTAVSHVKNIFTKALPVSILGMDVTLMEQFIELSADTLLYDTNNEKIFKIEKTPFDWIVEPKIDMNEAPIPNLVLTTSASNGSQNEAKFGLDEEF